MTKTQSAVARKRARADLETLTGDAEDILKATVGDMSQKATPAPTRIASAFESVRTPCAHFREQTVAAARVVAKKADTVIRQHPYGSIGFAFAVGLLIGVLGTRTYSMNQPSRSHAGRIQ